MFEAKKILAKYRQVLTPGMPDRGAIVALLISLPRRFPCPPLLRCKNLGIGDIPAEGSHGSRKGEETATKYCVRAENTALGTRVSGIPYEQIGPPIIR